MNKIQKAVDIKVVFQIDRSGSDERGDLTQDAVDFDSFILLQAAEFVVHIDNCCRLDIKSGAAL